MSKLVDKLNAFLISRQFSHAETKANNEKRDVPDELTSEELELLLKLDAADAGDDIKTELKEINNKLSGILDSVTRSQWHLAVIKMFLIIFVVIVIFVVLSLLFGDINCGG